MPVREMISTSGADLLLPMSNLMGGCSKQQLSELIALNGMSVELLDLASGYNDIYIRGSSYSYEEVIDFCTEKGE